MSATLLASKSATWEKQRQNSRQTSRKVNEGASASPGKPCDSGDEATRRTDLEELAVCHGRQVADVVEGGVELPQDGQARQSLSRASGRVDGPLSARRAQRSMHDTRTGGGRRTDRSSTPLRASQSTCSLRNDVPRSLRARRTFGALTRQLFSRNSRSQSEKGQQSSKRKIEQR